MYEAIFIVGADCVPPAASRPAKPFDPPDYRDVEPPPPVLTECPSPGWGRDTQNHQPIEIRRGWVSSALGSVRVSTPSSSWALIRSRSILLDSVKDRV